MKKSSILVIFFIIFIIFISVIGSFIVTGNTELKKDMDILVMQSNKEAYFSPYGYSLSNPNVILNPYGNSPLTALVMFETTDYVQTNITVKGKNDSEDINYSFDNDKYHLIPIYGLYPDYDNTIIIRCENEEKVINIKTDKLPDDFSFEANNEVYDNFYFNNTNYPYAYDKNKDVRWYLNRNYYGNISILDNSRIIIGSDRYDEDGNAISLYEMNLLGKIYSEYDILYYGYNTIYADNILAISDEILEIDRQTGDIINKYGSSDNIDYINGNDDIVIRRNGQFYKVTSKEEEISYNVKYDTYPLYNNTDNYKISTAVRYGNLIETVKSNKKISLIKYEKRKLDNIEISRQFDRLKIVNNTGDKIYIILDKFFDKRVYEISDTLYINETGLSGKYTLYFKIADKVYKTDYFIEV